MRRKCPDVLRKYGWCGVLALHYALNLSMPNSEAEFTARLFALRTIIGAKLPRWKPSTKPSRRGGITTTHTETVLSHYRDTCTYTLDRFVERRMTVNAWLRTANTLCTLAGTQCLWMYPNALRNGSCTIRAGRRPAQKCHS